MYYMQQDKLDFAYKYPFSKEAREIVAGLKVTSVDRKYLQEGVLQLSSAIRSGRITHARARGITEVKLGYIMGYVYARMLASTLGDWYSISRLASAEADAAAEFLALNIDELLNIASELGIDVKKEHDDFVVGFEQFVSVPKRDKGLMLINQRLAGGSVKIDVRKLLELVKGGIEKAVADGLPIAKGSLPKEVVEAAKQLKAPERKVALSSRQGAYAWIERLLATPIGDVRHRSVNLIFAPYLVNVKGMDEESAVRVIRDYIERCKKINPNTKITESYIRYQCRYAKNKGMRPLSLTKARDLLKEVAGFE